MLNGYGVVNSSKGVIGLGVFFSIKSSPVLSSDIYMLNKFGNTGKTKNNFLHSINVERILSQNL